MCLTLPLEISGLHLTLPICPASARALEQSLWVADEAERANSLLAVMRVDPTLTCFFVAELLPDRSLPSPDLQALARLAARSLAVLIGDKLIPSDLEESSQLSQHAAQAVVRAEVVFRLAEEHRCAEPGAFELAALAYGAASLVSLPANQLTDWLVRDIGLPDVAAFCSVAENLLLATPPTSAETPLLASAQLLENCEQLTTAVEQHWRQADAAAAADLLLLAARLAPLEALQHEFATRLETEKLLAMKELAYGAGHEINNPLANISVRAQTLIKQEQDPERRRMLAAINGQVYRAHEMIADLMLFAQPPKLAPTPTELQLLLERTVAGLLPDALRQNSKLRVRPAEAAIIANVDAIQLSLALHAMIVNSLEAMGQGGRIELQACTHRAARSQKWAEITVSDDGPGIDDEVRRHLFDPFYSGREAGRGLGFGLSKCWRIVATHGGRIDVESSPGHGACFRILLPV